jgi:FkbM family methyltransferase
MGIRMQLTLVAKNLIWGRRGEPYRIGGHTLRYLPGTRPVRLRYVDSPDGVTRYDALQLQLLASTLREGDTAIDIGAHAGQYCIAMAALCGATGRVVAFEPDPHARRLLERNLRLNPRLKRPVVEARAVSDASGEAVLYSRGGNTQSSLARSAVEFTAEQRSEPIRVQLVALDAYLAEHGLAPRWVKIDAEGAEIRILRGARALLAGDAGIVCELHPYAWPEFGNTLAELKELVAQSGRRMRYLDQRAPVGDRVEYGTVVLERPA